MRGSPRTRLAGQDGVPTGLVAAWGRGGLVRSIQAGTAAIGAGATTQTATITAVNLSNAFVLYLGDSYDTSDANASRSFGSVVLTNATTVTANRANTSGILTLGFMVIECQPGVIKSLQAGTVTNNGTAAITTVATAKTWLAWGGALASTTFDGLNQRIRIVLTNSTTVTGVVGSATATAVAYFTAVEFR